jgi:uncharacterized protein YbbC (DUF1343 family)
MTHGTANAEHLSLFAVAKATPKPFAMTPKIVSAYLAFLAVLGCTVTATQLDPTHEFARAEVTPGSEVLISDSIGLIRNKRIAVLTNHAAIDRNNRATVDLLASDPRVRAAGARLVMIFAPEHGIRADQDWENVRDTIDPRTRLPIHSLYGRTTVAPSDTLLRQIDALVFDLPDIGTRTWTYVGALVYSMRAAARVGRPIIVLDRPNPITGFFVEGPLLDSALANAEDDRPERRARPYALYPTPLRHGMTMGELALFFNDVLTLRADLHVIPMRRWSRDLWYDRVGLPWIRPSPNMPSLQSALLYPGLVAFEGTNVSVGRGTPTPFQWFGAPWMKVNDIRALLAERPLRGVKFVADTAFITNASDRKYVNRRVPGIRMLITERNRIQPARIGATILWALAKTSPDSLRVDTLAFDLRFGSPEIRRALMAGQDPDALMDREYAAAYAFREKVRKYFLYR